MSSAFALRQTSIIDVQASMFSAVFGACVCAFAISEMKKHFDFELFTLKCFWCSWCSCSVLCACLLRFALVHIVFAFDVTQNSSMLHFYISINMQKFVILMFSFVLLVSTVSDVVFFFSSFIRIMRCISFAYVCCNHFLSFIRFFFFYHFRWCVFFHSTVLFCWNFNSPVYSSLFFVLVRSFNALQNHRNLHKQRLFSSGETERTRPSE